MKNRIILLAALTLLGAATASRAAAPIVTNVVAAQRAGTKLVDIRYDATDADGDSLKVGVEVSHTGGQTFNIPATAFTGHYGDNVPQGTNRLIVWNAGTDWDGEYSTQMVVKVIASDAKGFPGLQWGTEVPLGGFLMGQEGGAEGTGPSKHVNIPWSYWLSKYEITRAQYCEFLNIALAAGKVVRVGTTSVKGNWGVVSNQTLLTLGNGEGIIWNVNSFELAYPSNTNYPIIVTWSGALAWAQFFGYDLPTDAEWEKAARGPDHAGVDQHQAYPWGNTYNTGNANYNTSYPKPVGYYNGNQIPIGPDMANGYGLYDLVGNVAEYTWDRSGTVESYPATEDLTLTRSIGYRGGDCGASPTTPPRMCCVRGGNPYYHNGFRVIRRATP